VRNVTFRSFIVDHQGKFALILRQGFGQGGC